MIEAERRIAPLPKQRRRRYVVYLLVVVCFFANQFKFGDSRDLSSLKENPQTLGEGKVSIPAAGSHPAVPKYPVCTRASVGREPYVCEGPRYEEFADKLEQFILWTHGENSTIRLYYPTEKDMKRLRQGTRTERNKKPTWGCRTEIPFPPNSNMLAFGSSHTRSIFSTIACQYEPLLLQDVEIIRDEETFPVRRGTYYLYEFANHAKVHLVTNHHMVYSDDWQEQLEELTGHQLNDFDVLFYGRFNDMYIPKDGSDKPTEIQGINLTVIANAYAGPIVGHTLIADWYFYATDFSTLADQRAKMSKVRAKTIILVDARRYMKVLGPCSTDAWKTAGECEAMENKHACLGARGGHADLVAWDMIEAMHEALEEQQATKS